jgi:hypothetical protein
MDDIGVATSRRGNHERHQRRVSLGGLDEKYDFGDPFTQLIPGYEEGHHLKQELLGLSTGNTPKVTWQPLFGPENEDEEKEKILIWTATHSDTNWTLYKMETIVDAPPALLFDLLSNVDEFMNWEGSCQVII